MIEIKKLGFNLNKTTVTITATELNTNPTSAPFNFTGTPILFITIQNNAGINFNNVFLSDNLANDITHHAAVDIGCYSIAFSGDKFGNPMKLCFLADLSNVFINWTFPGTANGNLIVNIYTFAI